MLALWIFRCFALLLNSSALPPLNQPQHPHCVAATAPSPSLLQGSTKDPCGCIHIRGDFPPSPSPAPVSHWALHPVNFPLVTACYRDHIYYLQGTLPTFSAWLPELVQPSLREGKESGKKESLGLRVHQLSSSGDFPTWWLCWPMCIHKFKLWWFSSH